MVEASSPACCRRRRAAHDSVESRLAALLFAVPAVKGVEFGAGFAAAALRGSENNDGYIGLRRRSPHAEQP
ncbi:MAG: chorismate synthase [Acutalibacteraceae bacterium]